MKGFPGLHQYTQTFGTDDQCRTFLEIARWGTGFTCPRCEASDRYTYLVARKKFQCYACKYQCSVTAGTIFQDTKLPLSKWFLAAYLILTTKKGISTPELARKLDVAQSTAWFLNHKILNVLGHTKALRLFGLVEADETYIGGKKPGAPPGRGTTKETVLGLVEVHPKRLGQARFHHVPDASHLVLGSIIRHECRDGVTIRSDGWRAYRGIPGTTHDPRPQEPGKEGRDMPAIHLLFSNLKKVIKGVHTHLSPAKMQAYLNLFAYRYNWRDNLWGGLYAALIELVNVPPTSYKSLVAATAE